VQSILPSLAQVKTQVERFWAKNGYKGYILNPELFYTDYIPAGRGITPHIDYYQEMGSFLQAGLSFSLSTGHPDSGAVIRVARPGGDKSFHGNKGDIDIPALLEWQGMVDRDEVTWTEVTVGYGDLFVLPQHPTPTAHGVVASPQREAYILDYLAFSAPQV
jgi:hypothetical protein